MIIHLSNISRAKQAAKSLKLNLDKWHIMRPLTWHQDTVAAMLGHRDWKSLLASVGEKSGPSPSDEDVDDMEFVGRHKFQTEVLIARIGIDVVERCLGPNTFEAIVKHVAPSGRPRTGTAHRTLTAELTDDGIVLPMSLWREDALLKWTEIRTHGGYEHVSRFYDPAAEELHAILSTHHLSGKDVERCKQYIEGKPHDHLDALVILTRLYTLGEQREEAFESISSAFEIGSLAWAPLVRERHRMHNPVRWWQEKETRAFMRVLYEKALVELSFRSEASKKAAATTFGILLTLNPDDPMNVTKFADTNLVFHDEKLVRSLLKELQSAEPPPPPL